MVCYSGLERFIGSPIQEGGLVCPWCTSSTHLARNEQVTCESEPQGRQEHGRVVITDAPSRTGSAGYRGMTADRRAQQVLKERNVSPREITWATSDSGKGVLQPAFS